MSNYYIRKVLEKDTAQTILNWMESDSCEYEDGIKTLSGTESDESKKIIKRNIEAVGPSEVRSEMRQLMWKEFDTDVDFFSFTAPEVSGSPMFTKTYSGGYYKPHQDAPSNGDFSTTIFLCEPDSYGGGALRLLINGNVEDIKLPMGHAITYKTGIPHQVQSVEYGNRFVSVFWTTSKFSDETIRRYWGVLSKLLATHNLPSTFDQYGDTNCNLEDCSNSSEFMIRALMYDMERDFRRKF
jgi:PKHD-type hydroxylase